MPTRTPDTAEVSFEGRIDRTRDMSALVFGNAQLRLREIPPAINQAYVVVFENPLEVSHGDQRACHVLKV